MKSTLKAKFRIWVVLASLPSFGFACGIDWSLPVSHFSGVSPQGNVDLWEKIGEIDLGSGSTLPLHIEFASTRGSSSPVLGKGWFFPLLESNVVQEDENTFRVYQPEGRYRYFWRDKNDPNILHGQGGWKGEIGNNTLTVWADCGGKLVFNKGKLISMSMNDGKVITLKYGEGGAVTDIRGSDSTILEVARNPASGEVEGLLLPNQQKIGIERGSRPNIQVISNQKLVGGVDPSLAKLTFPDGRTKTYEFGANQELNPTLTLDGKRVIVWDAVTGRIKKDGDWSYDIVSDANIERNAAIGRKNGEGKTEFWHLDSSKGMEITQTIDGVRNERSWFTSGPLSGKARSHFVITKDGKKQILYSYNEKGEPIRIFGLNGEVVSYNQTIEDGKKLTKVVKEGIEVAQYQYEPGKIIREDKDNTGGKTETLEMKGTQLVARTQADGNKETYQYGNDKQLISKSDTRGNNWEFKYLRKEDIEISESYKNGVIATRTIKGPDKNPMFQLRYDANGKLKAVFNFSLTKTIMVNDLTKEFRDQLTALLGDKI